MMQVQETSDRLREAKQAMYQEHILDIAEEVFAELGYEGTQVKLVASRAKISLSTLYSHFSNKMALYRAVHARRLDALMGELSGVGLEFSCPLEQMLAGMGGYITFHMQHPNYLKMHLREGNAWSEADGLYSPEQPTNWQKGLERMAGTFKAGMKAGLFVKDDPMLAARTTNAMHQVALSHWVEGGMRMKSEKLLSRVHAQFIRTFCRPGKVVELLEVHGLEVA